SEVRTPVLEEANTEPCILGSLKFQDSLTNFPCALQKDLYPSDDPLLRQQ
ncbi:unnamed protein product, partial [Allacma fusca]